MTIEIQKPELGRMMREEIMNGHFVNMDELLTEALQALREKKKGAGTGRPRKNLAQFLLESSFAVSDLSLERQQDFPQSEHFSVVGSPSFGTGRSTTE